MRSMSPSIDNNIDARKSDASVLPSEHGDIQMKKVNSQTGNKHENEIQPSNNKNGTEGAIGATIILGSNHKSPINVIENEANVETIVYNGEALEYGYNGIDENNDNSEDNEGELLYDEVYDLHQGSNATVTGKHENANGKQEPGEISESSPIS